MNVMENWRVESKRLLQGSLAFTTAIRNSNDDPQIRI